MNHRGPGFALNAMKRLKDNLQSAGTAANPGAENSHLEDGSAYPQTYDMFSGKIRGKRPVTMGYYSRYIPPEILGFPVYFESFLNYRVQGSQLMSFGASLVFRPQI